MGTSCVINFCHKKEVIAKVYRHFDGGPDKNIGVDADLIRFFAAVKKECGKDTRFDDPSYLAAKFVVWQAREYSDEPGSLNFVSVGVVLDDPSVAYRWYVNCSSKKAPKIWFESTYDEDEWRIRKI